MKHLTFIALPDHLTRLLSTQASDKSFNDILTDIYQNSSDLRMIVNLVFRETIEKTGLGSLTKVVGNQEVRDRLILAYLNRVSGDNYRSIKKISNIKELLWLEDILRPYTTHGHSRAMLLGLYFKCLELQSGSYSDSSDDSALINMEKLVRPYLTYLNGKVAKIDWICLQIYQYAMFLGHDKLALLLQSGANYEKIWKMLEDEHKRMMINNSMIYGMSIGEADMFASIILNQQSAH